MNFGNVIFVLLGGIAFALRAVLCSIGVRLVADNKKAA